MNLLFRLLLGALVAFSFGCTPRQARHTPADTPPAPLLLVSIDGYRHDYLDRGLSPALAQLARDGVQAASMQPAFPSLTFPNHYSLVTGLRPDHHGVVSNTMFDAQLGRFSLGSPRAISDGRWWDGGVPLWETARQHGLRSATMFWPGSEAAIRGHHPNYWKPFDAKVSADQRVDQVLAWLDLPAAQRPSFLTLYFDDVDHAGHIYGPDSAPLDDALRTTDAALARLLRGLQQRGLYGRINLIVLSDHGMASVPAGNNVMLDQMIPLDQVQVVSLGILAGFNPTADTPAARAAFARIEHQLERPQPHMQCWNKARIPARFAYGHNPRVPQLVCLADIHWRITTAEYIARRGSRVSLGEHGFDNADPMMQAVFVAQGPAFRIGAKVPAFPNVDVYPLMAHLLGLPAAANDGDYNAVKDMLKPAAR